MKRKKTIKHRIEQKTADRKKARQRKSHIFRLLAKKGGVKVTKAIKEAKAAASFLKTKRVK